MNVITRLRLSIVRFVCLLLLPSGVVVVKYFGIYTQKHGVVFGVVDDRGVLQGRTDDEICRIVANKERE